MVAAGELKAVVEAGDLVVVGIEELLVKQSWSSNAFPAESKYIAIMVRRHVPHPLDRDLSPFRTIPPFCTVCLRQAIFSLRGDTIRAERSRVAMVARGDRTPWQICHHYLFTLISPEFAPSGT